MSPRTSKQFEKIREESKGNILNVALKLFSSKGYFNTSVRQIAKEAKVSDGLLYNYFKSKEELALAVLQSAFETLDDTILDLDTNSPIENINGSITRFIDLIHNELDKIRLLAQMGIHKEKFVFLNEVTVIKYKSSVSKFENSLNQMGVDNSQAEAEFIVAILDGLVFESLLMEGGPDLEKIKRNLIQKYCNK
jgi:AcrR family transcriptional regulator